MKRLAIMTCSNATQDLGCASVACLADLRKHRGKFSLYGPEEELLLVGIINCPGCPTLTGPEKLLERIRALTSFRLDAVHFSYCVKALCPFAEKYRKALETEYPQLQIVLGTHEEHMEPEAFREKVRCLFKQRVATMTDVVLGKF